MNSLSVNEIDENMAAELPLGQKIRELRTRRGFSLRALSNRSGLNVNTLSLIENMKTSPSVSTLQQLAQALGVSIVAFFESEPKEKQVVFTSTEKRPQLAIGGAQLQHLGKDLAGNAVQPFFITMKPGMNSGDRQIVHTGHEFVYCLEGSLQYWVENKEYPLRAGDSLLFEAHLPHQWANQGAEAAQILLILFPLDHREEPVTRHFPATFLNQEVSMKIAVITDDGKTISQHFGRAPYYLVLTIEEGKIIDRELRSKMGHSQFSQMPHSEDHHEAGRGHDAGSHNKHVRMAETIADCKALLCGGMGMGAYESMRQLNIQPIVTDLRDIDAAAQAFIEGKLIDHTELLH